MRKAIATLLLGALIGVGCSGEQDNLFNNGTGGSGASGVGGDGNTGGQGGQGAGPSEGCFGGCSGDTPVCVDGDHCADLCPGGREACNAANDPDAPPVCCPEGQQCCEAQIFGYTGADLCRPSGEACPIGCPGGDIACPLHEYCQLNPQLEDYSCVMGCPLTSVCGFNLCCPLGSSCLNGECILPDLTIDQARVASTLSFSQVNADSDPCLVSEDCLAGPGLRNVLRFSSRTQNVGAADFVIGSPNGNPDFHYDQCHGHYHYQQYAEYRLIDPSNNNVVLTGKKQGFSIIDMGRIDPDDPNTPTTSKYNGAFQGIQRGWWDEYGAGLQCQWIDVTGVPAGDYILEVEVNPERRIGETSYDNNVASVPVTLPDPTCLGVDCSFLDSDCTQGVCEAGQGCVEVNVNEGGACEDGQFCTTGETCQAGACGGGTPRLCAPPNGCYAATCDENADTCSAVPANDGAACDDGSPCTDGTTCANGACLGGAPANDGMTCDDGASCTTNTICTAGVCGGGDGPTVYFSEDFSDNSQGWVLGPEWEIGPAQASTGAHGGANDPANDHTDTADNGVAGVNIGGFAAKIDHAYYYLESPPFNTAVASGPVVLGYQRWLNSDFIPYMSNTVEVWNGTGWISLWTSGPTITDATIGWNYHQFDLTPYKNAGMKVRFGFMVSGAQVLWDVGSWNLDDILVASLACP
ncbi:lysyl oxidase family protein [Chondromyces apiculatus]|uniref:YHYH domain-containing protein n=1 Tax=Chondromyces apiculatus DSM 436 TaxID=1192034 RepID=A0A017TJ43_9BACT|nr:lysyl oxidase family protein [Chondromyces apiculatus]EYF08912.1 Hypothetical protein CAP_2773 [Chondromyces apiculatus DSM 436]